MRYFFLILFIGLGAIFTLPAESNHVSVQVASNFDMMIPDDCGHQTPLVEFMRRYERIVRNTSNLNNTASSQTLSIQLNSRFAPDQYRFFKSQDNITVLEISADLQGLLTQAKTGRVLTAALLQSRLGNDIDRPLPPPAHWIADGLWAEFIHRETLPFHIMHFSYLAAMRNLAENNCRIRLDQKQLTAPIFRNSRAPEWVLYTQRAQLMLKIADHLIDRRRSNLLKDYLYLLENGKLAPEECFELTFAKTAAKKLITGADKDNKEHNNDRLLTDKAMELAALRMLFSLAAPMGPTAAAVRLNPVFQVTYRTARSSEIQKAELSDLPLLVQKYDSCAALPAQKIREFNEIISIMPMQIRPEIINLSKTLAELALLEPQTASANIKKDMLMIREKLTQLSEVDRQLQSFERSLQTPLYRHRYSVGDVMQQPPLPENINRFIEQNQNSGVL